MNINTNTGETSFLKSVIHYGSILGAFWVFKYLFLMASVYVAALGSLFHFLSAGTFFVFFWLVTQYRDNVLEGRISYGKCVLFGLLVFVVAAIPETVVTFIHYRFVDPMYTVVLADTMLQMIDKMHLPTESVAMLKRWLSYGDIYFVVNSFIGNIVVGFFLSLICGIFVKREKVVQ